jgi:hypothetical protein
MALAIGPHLGEDPSNHCTSKMLCLYPMVLTFGERAVSGFLFTSVSCLYSHAHDILSSTGPEVGARPYISNRNANVLPNLYHFALGIQLPHCKWFHAYSI